MKRVAIFLCITLLATLAVGCAEAQRPQGGRAPDFELKDITGQTVTLSDYSGKVIILNFFTTWCGPCRVEMPDFDEIQKEYKNDVKVIAVNVGGESLSRVREFARANGLDFTIAVDDGRVSRLYGPIRAIPVTVIIDRQFNIRERYLGMKTKTQFLSAIKRLL